MKGWEAGQKRESRWGSVEGGSLMGPFLLRAFLSVSTRRVLRVADIRMGSPPKILRTLQNQKSSEPQTETAKSASRVVRGREQPSLRTRGEGKKDGNQSFLRMNLQSPS